MGENGLLEELGANLHILIKICKYKFEFIKRWVMYIGIKVFQRNISLNLG